MKVEMVPIGEFLVDESNLRKSPVELTELIESIRTHGIQVPLIGYRTKGKVIPVDGKCRLEASRMVGIAELPVVILDGKPTEAELLVAQLTINGHRQALNPVDRWKGFERLMSLNNWSPGQLAKALAISNSEVTSILALGKLTPEERALVQQGKIKLSAAYAISRMPAEERAEWVSRAAAGEVTRDQLNVKARRKKCAGQKKGRVRFEMPFGLVSVAAHSQFDLAGCIELLDGLSRELRKLRGQGLDVATASRVLLDRTRNKLAPKS